MDPDLFLGALGVFLVSVLTAQWQLVTRMLRHSARERTLDRQAEERLQDQLLGVLRDQAVTLRHAMAGISKRLGGIERKISAVHLAVTRQGESEECDRERQDSEDHVTVGPSNVFGLGSPNDTDPAIASQRRR